jgi:hypothetical protein
VREDRLIATGFGAACVPAADSGPGGSSLRAMGRSLRSASTSGSRRLARFGWPIDRLVLDGAFFSVSAKTLIYRRRADYQLAWFDSHGRELARVGEPADFPASLSPDGNRALVSIQAPQGTANQDLWLFDFPRAPFRDE